MGEHWQDPVSVRLEEIVRHRPVFLQRRDALLVEIARAFSGVHRRGGVSISEALIIDDRGTAEERAEARARDRDTHWDDIDLQAKDPQGVVLNFVDPIGFRYHLPTVLTYVLRHNGSIDPDAHISSWNGHDSYLLLALGLAGTDGDARRREWAEEKASLLNDDQLRCWARCIALETTTDPDPFGLDEIQTAIRSYWHTYLVAEERDEVLALKKPWS